MNSFVSLTQPPEPVPEPALWFVFHKYQLLVINQADGTAVIPTRTDIAQLPLIRSHYLGHTDHNNPIHAFCAELPEGTPAPDGFSFSGLRRLYGLLPDEHFWLAGRAVQIVDWDRTHQFCGRCATPMEEKGYERAKQCPNCHLVNYPRLSPAIIVAVEHGNKILLARSARYTTGFYSVLAGFVEPGETLEECVQREVKEEVGVDVTNIRYFGSQPWPFPNSLMLGFIADYAGGEIVLEEEEIADAQWFTPQDLPKTPSSISISYSLIQQFVNKHQ